MLFRKLLRTMLRYKAQFISMIIMITIGIGVFTGFNIEWYSLKTDAERAYAASGFSDFRIVSETGFSAEDLQKIEALPDVTEATRYLSVNVTRKDDSDVIALTVTENPAVSGTESISGAEYDPDSVDGIWLSDQYAAKNQLSVGDRMTFVYRNAEIAGTVRGLIKASEYLICLPDDTQLMPDYSSYGFAYISPKMLKEALGFEFYSQINVKCELSKADFTAATDRALGRTCLVLSKDDTVSYAEMQGEVEEGKTMGSVLPVLFLAIAVLTMVTTMHRLTSSEKTQIGTLKAMGLKDRRIVVHYTSYALFIGVVGTALGIGLGYLLGWFIMNPSGAMGTYIDMSDWSLYMPSFCWWVLILINLLLVFIGYLSVRTMLKGNAADALRPYVPKKVKPLLVERTGLWNKLPFGARWNLRDSLRHMTRTLMTLVGIVGCTLILAAAMGMKDTADAFVDTFFYQAINYRSRINLDAADASDEDVKAFAEKYDGDWSAHVSVQIGDEPVSLEIYSVTGDKVRFVNEDMDFVPLGDDGAYVCSRIAADYGLSVGDTVTLSPYDSDVHYTLRVAGVLRSMARNVVISENYARQEKIDYRISTVYTDAEQIPSDPLIKNVQSKQSIVDSFDTFMDLMNTMVILLAIAAMILGVVVLYNLGIMSYTERYREMATLKVVGFKDKKIGRILIGQNLWLTLIGVLIGVPAGIVVLQYLLDGLAGEYEMRLALGPLTFLGSVVLTFAVSLLVGWMISRKNVKINMTEALKGTD